MDELLSAIVPGILFILFVDWPGLFRTAFEQLKFDESGRIIPGSTASFTFPMTTELILVYLILVAVQYLYFVGFWTSRWQATPGMIGLKMRVVDGSTGAGLTMLQATRRWFAMGWWLTLLTVVPVFQAVAGLAQFGLNLFLLFSTLTNDRKQGWHDKFANSQVIRSVTSGEGATFIGCLVYIAILILITIVAGLAFFVIAGPALFELARDLPRYQQ